MGQVEIFKRNKVMKLIDKDALVAEIDRRIKVLQKNPYENHKTICHLNSLKQSLDILEVKEVDEQQERMSECPFKKVGCEIYEGHILECKGECSWVVDHPKLKQLKAQKEE